MGMGCQRHAPATLTPGMTRYPLYRRLGGPQGRSEPVRKISFQPGFDPWLSSPYQVAILTTLSRPTLSTVTKYFNACKIRNEWEVSLFIILGFKSAFDKVHVFKENFFYVVLK
jgi:hypothetical protein